MQYGAFNFMDKSINMKADCERPDSEWLRFWAISLLSVQQSLRLSRKLRFSVLSQGAKLSCRTCDVWQWQGAMSGCRTLPSFSHYFLRKRRREQSRRQCLWRLGISLDSVGCGTASSMEWERGSISISKDGDFAPCEGNRLSCVCFAFAQSQ